MNKNYVLPIFIVISGIVTGVSFGYHSTLEKYTSNDSKITSASIESSTLILYTDDFEIPQNNEQQIIIDLPVIIKLMESEK